MQTSYMIQGIEMSWRKKIIRHMVKRKVVIYCNIFKHETVIRTGITFNKISYYMVTQLAGGNILVPEYTSTQTTSEHIECKQ